MSDQKSILVPWQAVAYGFCFVVSILHAAWYLGAGDSVRSSLTLGLSIGFIAMTVLVFWIKKMSGGIGAVGLLTTLIGGFSTYFFLVGETVAAVFMVVFPASTYFLIICLVARSYKTGTELGQVS